MMMTEFKPYAMMAELKREIDSSDEFKARLRAAFDYTVDPQIENRPSEFLEFTRGRTRRIFSGFPKIDYGTNGDKAHFVLKTVKGDNDLPYSFNGNPGNDLRFLYAELGAFERFGEWHWVPGFFGVVVSREHNLAGMLMEDVSRAGTRKCVETDADKYQVLMVELERGAGRDGADLALPCYIDLKTHMMSGFIENARQGKKFLSSDVLVEI